VIIACILLATGILFSWLAIIGCRHRREDSISLLEAGILKATGEEPLPLSWFDRLLQRFQLVMMSIFGPALIFLGVVGLLIETGAI